jgi:hypothetical protein
MIVKRLRWRDLPGPHRRWIIVYALVGSVLTNAVVNSLLAWVSVVRQHRIPLWSWPLLRTSTEVNTVGTLFILPFVTTWLTTAAVWRELSTGRLAPLPSSSIGFLAHLPGGLARRGARVGVACLAVLAPAAVALVAGTKFGGVSRGDFVVFQTVFTVCFGAIVTPLVAVRAMADAERAGTVTPSG